VDPDPDKLKRSPKKFSWSLNVHDGLLAYKILNYKFKKFYHKNLVLAPDPNWIQIQQKPESGFRESGSETLPKIK
jgi:hypothetical protein